MHHFKQCKRLCPFCELAYATMDVPKPDKRYEEYDASKYSCPEHSADKVIPDQVLGSKTTIGGRARVHCSTRWRSIAKEQIHRETPEDTEGKGWWRAGKAYVQK